MFLKTTAVLSTEGNILNIRCYRFPGLVYLYMRYPVQAAQSKRFPNRFIIPSDFRFAAYVTVIEMP